MIWIPKSHPLRAVFARTLRDAIFLPDKDDKRRLISWLARQNPPMTWDECCIFKPTLIKHHCKMSVPPAEVLYPVVSKVIETYGPLKDTQGTPLFGKATWNSVKNILEYVRRGYISDPPGVALYIQLGIAENGLPLYRCCRGTNYTEGGVHRTMHAVMPINGVSPRHMNNRLLDYIYGHNVDVGTYNSTGHRYSGHYDLWLTNKRQRIINSEQLRLLVPSARVVTGWVNGDLYHQTDEVSGILPVPDSVRIEADMLSYSDALPPKRHAYLAKKQGTRFPVITIVGAAERRLYSNLMRDDQSFAGPNGPVWRDAVKRWNREANGETIFYKVRIFVNINTTSLIHDDS
ncbi:hypothetical protein BDZ89DRAFT_317341 [Hymenopellis radicata]|nr:hypothetical protein BDZ89DRAFT_317341 [Hymenopellis radicata]